MVKNWDKTVLKMPNFMTQRSFILGSEWLYYKIYVGAKTADLFLSETVLPLVQELKEKNRIEKWFFIRYADPKPHLRIRFLMRERQYIGDVIQLFFTELQAWVDADLIWKVQSDTYTRELERYGPDTIELSETIFWHDSETILQFLNMIEGEEGEKLRWLFGLRYIDVFLSAFAYTLQDKLEFLDVLKTSFGKEFNMARPLKKQLDDKYRKYRREVDDFMAFTPKDSPDYRAIYQNLEGGQAKIKSVAEQLLALEAKGDLQPNLRSLMNSYVHMLMNRLFKSKNRLNEMVCYDFLYRYYKSALARKKSTATR